MPDTRSLILMRHAKSAYPGGVRDHDRPLADRGRHEAGLAGDWLRAHFVAIDEVLCSTAVRATQTAGTAVPAVPIRLSAHLYEASPDDILEQIRKTAQSVRTLLVVGHGPGLPGLAMELAGSGSDNAAVSTLEARFPTAAMAVMEFDLGWNEMDLGEARLVELHIPRD